MEHDAQSVILQLGSNILQLVVSTSNSAHNTQFHLIKIGCKEELNVPLNT